MYFRELLDTNLRFLFGIFQTILSNIKKVLKIVSFCLTCKNVTLSPLNPSSQKILSEIAIGQKFLNFNKIIEKCFFRENNYQQVYLLFFSSNFLNSCAPTLRFGNKTGGLKNATRWVRTQFLWKSRLFEYFSFKFFQKEQFTSEFCFFLKKSSYLIDCGVEGAPICSE